LPSTKQSGLFQSQATAISKKAYSLLSQRAAANQKSFYVYQDIDSSFNHGFPSGEFGDINKIAVNPACLDAPTSSGCTTDQNQLDTSRGAVLQLIFSPMSSGDFAGLNIEEPENWGANQQGVGYELRNATSVIFDVRSPTGLSLSFGVNKCSTPLISLPASTTYTTMRFSPKSLTCSDSSADFSNVHVLFTIGVSGDSSPNGGVVLLDSIRFTPAPKRQSKDAKALSLPSGTQTFGVVPLSCAAQGRVPIPPDQINRNIASVYESALTVLALLKRDEKSDLTKSREIADAFDYALTHDNHGDPLPVGSDGSVGLHNAYESGDVALLNDQVAPKQGKAGDARLAGFTAPCLCSSTGFCLVLDGATGGNNAFAILALLAAYRQFQDIRYLNDAVTIGNWIVNRLTDTTGSGYGGYYLGFPDMGLPKILQTGKSTENNADIFSAFSALASMQRVLSKPTQAQTWTDRANAARDFVMQMFDSTGRFNAGL
jgi:hypothetical protein